MEALFSTLLSVKGILATPGLAILTLIVLLMYIIWKENKNGHLDWTDMITSNQSKVSLTKLLQLVGGITGTWIMIATTLHDKLTADLLMIYLTYVGAIEGWSKFVIAKYGFPVPPPPPAAGDKQ